MSGFSIDWLDLREGADLRARDSKLRQQALHWLEGARSPAQEPVVVDLGAGTGSSLRALATSDQQPLAWRLVDHDQALLAEAQRRHGHSLHIETCRADLSLVTALPLHDARLVTASALFDLVSAEFIDGLAGLLQIQNQCQPGSVGIYAALNYDGTTHWSPEHPLDALVLKAFNLDQRKNKGFGPALGPDAGDVMYKSFTQAGFKVVCASSPWVLTDADQVLVTALIEGIADAVTGSPGLDGPALADWVSFRKAQVSSGTCTVGHTDVLALPA